MHQQYLIYLYALLPAFFASLLLTALVRRLALRWNIVDHPSGGRKDHRAPTPLLGGVAIVATFYGFILLHIALLYLLHLLNIPGPARALLDFLGDDVSITLAGILAGGLLIFILGVVDDFRPLGPLTKLSGQIAAGIVLVASGLRIEAFILSNYWLSVLVTILWVVLLTNSLNFLDNMDGLCGGITVIAAFSFFLCARPEETLVRLTLMVFAGAVGGFLYHNLNPASIFMGDAGAMFNGYMLATIGLLGTFHIEGTPTPAAIIAPLVALSVPLFDTFSVMFIRWRAGVPLMQGDKRHFSHRLVALGMSTRQAVEFILLAAAVVGLGGALLPYVDITGALIIFGQTVGVFLLIVLLMNAGKKNGDNT